MKSHSVGFENERTKTNVVLTFVLDTMFHEFGHFVRQLRPGDCLTGVLVIRDQDPIIVLVEVSVGQ